MKRLDFEGLQYYTSKLLGKIKSWFVGSTPTVQVRPSNDMSPKIIDGLTLGLGSNRIGPDIESNITADLLTDQLRFVIHCDSVESAQNLCNSGEYVLRFSYLSRRYDTPKWVCPSRNKSESANGRWYDGTTWDEVPIDSSHFQSKSQITLDTGNTARDMMRDLIDLNNLPSEVLESLTEEQKVECVLPFMLENAVLFGSNEWWVIAKKVIRRKALFKGVLEYLSDTEQEVSAKTVNLAPSNAYSIPIKVSVWKGDLELPGCSIGALTFHKKRNTGLHSPIHFVYKYKETNKR